MVVSLIELKIWAYEYRNGQLVSGPAIFGKFGSLHCLQNVDGALSSDCPKLNLTSYVHFDICCSCISWLSNDI